MSAARRTAFVALGSNLGDRSRILEAALVDLDALRGARVDAVSAFHRTAPVGGPEGQPEFVNAVARLATDLAPEDLLAELRRIEAAHGRDRAREQRDGPRTLDLDLLLLEDERRDTAELELPHPRMEDRLFVLEPLSEVAPDLVLPVSGSAVRARIEALRARDAAAEGARP